MSDDVTDAGRPDSGDDLYLDPQGREQDLPDLATAYPDLASWVAAQPAGPMPDAVWQRLESVLAEQQPLSISAESIPTESIHAESIPGVTSIATARATRRPRRLAPILGAAAGLVLVGAVGIPVVLGGNAANPPVADGPALAEPRATTPPASSPDPVATAEPVAPSEPTAQPSVEPEPTTVPVVPSGDAMAVPARLLVASGTDYSADAIDGQVTSLLTTAGFGSDDDMAEDVVTVHSSKPAGLPPLIGASGFTADMGALRDCVGRLHAARGGDAAGLTMPALLVDRAQYEGADVGVVVMLHNLPGGRPYLDVAMVGPECTDADVAAAVWFEYALP